MALDFLVYGIAPDGKRTRIAATPSAHEARTYRDAANSRWAKTMVFGSEGEMTGDELDRAADLEAIKAAQKGHNDGNG